ncbi:F-box protein CPR1-like [Tripterygium wilfordii]|uniref:F-box protein CPR1-like n=1 Tax=Tripterygium wilfordii TaxID=458696 RepID=UPI0018F84B37|nr:F-box protein CPR1-like [Tripterygium wilfordii]
MPDFMERERGASWELYRFNRNDTNPNNHANLDLGRTSKKSEANMGFGPNVKSQFSSLSVVSYSYIFRSVSKSWRSLLEEPLFLDSHRKQTNKKSLIIQTDDLSDSNPTSFLTSDFDSIDKLKEIAFSPDPDLGRSYSCVKVIGSFNGLVALSCTYDQGTQEDVVIWNISTTERQILPDPFRGELYTCLPTTPSVGFGYDSVSDSYKIVKLRVRSSLLSTVIYNLKRNHVTWSLDDFPGPHSLVHGRGLLFEESLHWVSFLIGTKKCSIVGFGLEKEELYQVPLPDCVERNIALGVWGTCLSMTNTDSAGDIWVWVMKKKYMVEESWTKIYSRRLWDCFGVSRWGRWNPLGWEKSVFGRHN